MIGIENGEGAQAPADEEATEVDRASADEGPGEAGGPLDDEEFARLFAKLLEELGETEFFDRGVG
ncbi:MAG: hypothetical protein AAGF90_04885 [Pseudomonadota bacterium]